MAAWPKWVASYGVMPHVYMVTTSPGSNGTTASSTHGTRPRLSHAAGRSLASATRTGKTSQLYGQIQWVVVGAALGALASWLLLPTFIEVYSVAVRCITHRGSMIGALMRMLRPASWLKLVRSFRLPSNLGCRLFKLDGVPADFLLFNVAATAVWTVGALAAVYVSAVIPHAG